MTEDRELARWGLSRRPVGARKPRKENRIGNATVACRISCMECYKCDCNVLVTLLINLCRWPKDKAAVNIIQ